MLYGASFEGTDICIIFQSDNDENARLFSDELWKGTSVIPVLMEIEKNDNTEQYECVRYVY